MAASSPMFASSTTAVNHDVDKLPVVYSGSLQFPVCIGTIAIPLHLPQPFSPGKSPRDENNVTAKMQTRPNCHSSSLSSGKRPIMANRFTHRRYCYIRDGSDPAEDAFYRWLHHTLTNSPAEQAAEYEPEGKETEKKEEGEREKGEHCGKKNKRQPTSSSGNFIIEEEISSLQAAPQRKCFKTESGAQPTPASSTPEKGNHSEGLSITSNDPRVNVKSPSVFYAMMHHVEFILPNSFPKPRRILYEPPFIIDDNCWAEHLIEVHLFFHPSLGIAPVVLLQHAFLHPRELLLTNEEKEKGMKEMAFPQLSAKSLGRPKPPPLFRVSTTGDLSRSLEYDIRVEGIPPREGKRGRNRGRRRG